MSLAIVQANVSLLVVSLFLAMTLAIGCYFSKKKITFREYAVGDKRFATSTLVATVMATAWGGGGLIRTVQKVHQLGWYWVIVMGGSVCCFWIISRLAVRMGPFMEHFSMTETVGSVYGKRPGVFTALASILNCIAGISIQIHVMSNAIQMCTGIAERTESMALVATGILILYSAFGGIRSVTFTDVFQFATFGLLIPCVLWFVFLKVGKPVPEIAATLAAHEKFQLGKVCHWNTNLFSMACLLLCFITGYVGPTTVQRVYMAANPLQAKQTFKYVVFIDGLLCALVMLIGVCVFASNPDFTEAQIWPYILNSVPPIVKIGVAVSLLAMTMSTADSSLNACSVLIAHDIVPAFPGGEDKLRSGRNKVKVARITTLVVGTLAMLLAFCSNDLLKLVTIGLDY